ncbi:hypothetical protein Fot_09945 [Forsythia ovata]|uniref:Uncharacterized protein n=1 Tax=Forsythia ovata TaxID=205694 RepID=A0ABD1WFG1_9LAMI
MTHKLSIRGKGFPSIDPRLLNLLDHAIFIYTCGKFVKCKAGNSSSCIFDRCRWRLHLVLGFRCRSNRSKQSQCELQTDAATCANIVNRNTTLLSSEARGKRAKSPHDKTILVYVAFASYAVHMWIPCEQDCKASKIDPNSKKPVKTAAALGEAPSAAISSPTSCAPTSMPPLGDLIDGSNVALGVADGESLLFLPFSEVPTSATYLSPNLVAPKLAPAFATRPTLL